MQRHRRLAPREQKRDTEALDNILTSNGQIDAHLKYRQLKTDLELMKLENKLNKQIHWLQMRQLEQLNEM